jgi:hypothetical protein
LNDMGFGWKHKDWGANQQVFLPSKYMNALGHSADYYPLEFGGDTIPTIQPDLNFGFTTAGGDKTCYWGMKANYLPNGTSASGANKTDDTDNPISSVRYASNLEQHPAGVLLWGTIPWTHLANPGLNYRMSIRLRIVDHNPGVRKNVFQIALNRSQVLIEDDPKIEAKRYFFKEPVPPPIESVGLSQVVTTDDLDEFTQYGWFETRGFNVTQDMNVSFSIYWYGDVDVYIDKVIFYSNEYRDIYVTEDIEMVRDIINGTTGLTANGNYPNDVGPTTAAKFQNFYVDEPFQLSANYRKELQHHIFQKGGLDENSTLEINGATGGVPAYFLQFDQKWAKPDNYKLKNYLLYNIYPFDKNTTYHQSIVQQRFDVMIGYRNYTDGAEANYQYSGLRRAQMAAQNFTAENISDDIPLIFTMGVHSEQYIDGVTNNYIDGPHRRRAPTWSEIFAQGNIAIAYGAKGFMYYMIPTRTTTPDQDIDYKDTVWNTYGLFDEVGNMYDTSHTTSSGKIQNPAALQIPNSRYNAVKAFINSTNLIASELLQLKWIDANSWHNPTPGIDNYINTVVTTRVHSNGTTDDESYETYVESGYFLKPTSASSTVDDERFVYLVNRRCNQNKDWLGYDNSDRIVSFFVTRFKDYVNYKITNLKSNTVYYKTYNQQFTIHLDAGEGTLLKIEPVVHSGGTLLESETVKHSVDVKSDLVFTPGKTLQIFNGADMRFLNSSRLDVSSAILQIVPASLGGAKLDFVARNWTAGNGIIAGGANVFINNAIISNGSAGISAWNPASLSISNTTIENCWFGVAVQSRPIGSVYLDNVKVLNCDARGVTLDNANLEIKNSRISGSDIRSTDCRTVPLMQEIRNSMVPIWA